MVVVDADAFHFLFRARKVLNDPLRSYLDSNERELVTIATVHRRELIDGAREYANELGLEVRPDPDEASLTRAQRKQRRKIARKARNSPASTNDEQLAFLAMDEGAPLLTQDRRLASLATTLGGLVLEPLQVLAVLNSATPMADTDLDEALRQLGGDPPRSPTELEDAVPTVCEA